MTKPNSKAIAVLGMHRSGTSVTARVVQLLGAYLGEESDLMPTLPDNPAGYWERTDIWDIHERTLQRLNTSWDTSFDLPHGWHRSPEVAPLREELVDLVKTKFMHQRLWAWKDPRTVILFPLWKDVLAELGIAFGCLLVARNPLDVAKSLERRDGFSIEEGLGIWYNYNLALLRDTSDAPRALVTYDRLLADWGAALAPSAEILSLPVEGIDEKARAAIDKAVRKDLRHSASKLDDLAQSGCPGPIIELAGMIDQIGRQGFIWENSVDNKVKQLFETHSAVSRLYRHDILRVSRRAHDIQRHAANLENARSAQMGEVARLTEHSRALEEKAQKLATAGGELQSLRRRVQEESQSAQAAAQEFDEVRSVLQDKRQELAQTQSKAEALAKSVDGAQHVIGEQKEEIACLRRLLEDRALEAQDLTKALAEFHGSQSWRITKPLRAVYDALRSLGRSQS